MRAAAVPAPRKPAYSPRRGHDRRGRRRSADPPRCWAACSRSRVSSHTGWAAPQAGQAARESRSASGNSGGATSAAQRTGGGNPSSTEKPEEVRPLQVVATSGQRLASRRSSAAARCGEIGSSVIVARRAPTADFTARGRSGSSVPTTGGCWMSPPSLVTWVTRYSKVMQFRIHQHNPQRARCGPRHRGSPVAPPTVAVGFVFVVDVEENGTDHARGDRGMERMSRRVRERVVHGQERGVSRDLREAIRVPSFRWWVGGLPGAAVRCESWSFQMSRRAVGFDAEDVAVPEGGAVVVAQLDVDRLDDAGSIRPGNTSRVRKPKSSWGSARNVRSTLGRRGQLVAEPPIQPESAWKWYSTPTWKPRSRASGFRKDTKWCGLGRGGLSAELLPGVAGVCWVSASEHRRRRRACRWALKIEPGGQARPPRRQADGRTGRRRLTGRK